MLQAFASLTLYLEVQLQAGHTRLQGLDGGHPLRQPMLVMPVVRFKRVHLHPGLSGSQPVGSSADAILVLGVSSFTLQITGELTLC